MKQTEKLPLIVICIAGILVIAWVSDFFETITNHPFMVLGMITLLAFVVRKPAYAIISGTAGQMSSADDEAMEKSHKKDVWFENFVWRVVGSMCLAGGLFFCVMGWTENGVTLIILGLVVLGVHHWFIKEK